MKNFIFKNLETSKDININLGNKDIVYIYGGNGSGKTTFSREFETKLTNTKVFNIDFVNKNVFVTDTDGAKTDARTKENFSTLFVSEESVELAKMMLHIRDYSKMNEKDKIDIIHKIDSKFKNYKIQFNGIEEAATELETESKFNFNKELDYNKTNFSVKNSLYTSITSDDELVKQIEVYLSNNEYRKFIDEFNKNPDLKIILRDDQFIIDLNSSVNEYNDNLENMLEIEKHFSNLGDSQKISEWIRKGLVLHKNKNKCILCSSDNIETQLLKWGRIVEDKFIQKKEELLNEIIKTIRVLNDNIILQNSKFEKFAPTILISTKKMVENLKSIKEDITKSVLIKTLTEKIEIDLTFKEDDELHRNISNYILNKDLSNYFFTYFFSEYLKQSQQKAEIDANQKSEEFANDTREAIKEIGEKLGLKKEIKVLNETRKGQVPKLSISPSDKGLKIGDFSEGQRHKLALAIFFAQVVLSKEKIDYLVLDDPMISLDVVTYHKLKKFLISELENKYDKLIVLTHNLTFLLVMLSNVYRNNELSNKTKLLELNPNIAKDIPLTTIIKDDIVLFKDSVESTETIDDISIWSWMILKISRYFIDLKLSFLSISSFDNVFLDLEKIFEEPELGLMKKKHESFVKIARSTNTNVGDVLNGLTCLNEFINYLGFPALLEDSLIINLKKQFDLEMKLVGNPVAKNIEYEILLEGKNISLDSSIDNNMLRSYINHPRHQITDSLVAFKIQKDQ